MNSIATTAEVRTFGEFSLIVNGSVVEPAWQNETERVLFCSLLLPLDESISEERLCRSLWGVPAEHTSRIRLMGMIQQLRHYFFDLTGSDLFIATSEGFALDQKKITVDATLFRHCALAGLQLLARGDCTRAYQQLQEAYTMYRAPFLPGVPGRLVDMARDDLDGLYGMVVAAIMPRQIAVRC